MTRHSGNIMQCHVFWCSYSSWRARLTGTFAHVIMHHACIFKAMEVAAISISVLAKVVKTLWQRSLPRLDPILNKSNALIIRCEITCRNMHFLSRNMMYSFEDKMHFWWLSGDVYHMNWEDYVKFPQIIYLNIGIIIIVLSVYP